MLGQVDISVCLSVALALLWQKGLTAEEPLPSRQVAEQAFWHAVMFLRHSNQVLPSVLVFLAARSMGAVLYAGFTLGLHSDGGGWLGDSPGSIAQLAVQFAVLIWRAEKVETLLQRMQRSASVVKVHGLGGCIKNGFTDPWEWLWPAFWGSFRRFALVAVSSVGYGSFVRAALPAVLFDEFLWWTISRCQDTFARKVCALPVTIDLVVMPFVDMLHMVPVISKVLLLGVLEYPSHTAYPTFLILCAVVWTGHNCHMAYSNMLVELPEHMRQIWAPVTGE